MSDHAILGPSSAKRWMSCTASVELIEKEGIHGTSDAAAEGTAAHTVLELELLKVLLMKGFAFESGRLDKVTKEVEGFTKDAEV